MKKALLAFVLLLSNPINAGGPYAGFNPTYPPPAGTVVSGTTPTSGGVSGAVLYDNGTAVAEHAGFLYDGSETVTLGQASSSGEGILIFKGPASGNTVGIKGQGTAGQDLTISIDQGTGSDAVTGSLVLTGGSASAGNIQTGEIKIYGNVATGDVLGGSVTVRGASAGNGSMVGGDAYLMGGDGKSNVGGNAIVQSGDSATSGASGNVVFNIPTGASSNGSFLFQANGVGVATMTTTGSLDLNTTVIDAYNSSFGAVTAGSTSTLTWTEVSDRKSEFSTSSFTVVTSGYYQVVVDAGASQTAGTGCLLLKVGGTTINGGEQCVTGVTAVATVLPLSITRTLNLTAGNILRVDASAASANTTFVRLHLSIIKVP